jgi:hypothetical protein
MKALGAPVMSAAAIPAAMSKKQDGITQDSFELTFADIIGGRL